MESYYMYQAQILYKQGLSRTAIAEALDVSRRTVYNYLTGRVFSSGIRRGRPKGCSKVSPFHNLIDARLDEDFDLNVEVLFAQLQQAGYTGGITILRDLVARRRAELENYAVQRFETSPGQQAQVDWADVGYVRVNGQVRKRYAFIMKLGYSRRSYIEFTHSMEQSVLFACMVRAFAYFGGVVLEVLFDNMKTAFLFDGESMQWRAHPRMAQFAQHCGFVPRRCRVRRPKTKGKVEREVRYLKHSFFPTLGQDRIDVPTDRLNELVLTWLQRVDGKVMREHGQSRLTRFEEDLRHLQGLPAVAFDYRKVEELKAGRDSMVTFLTNRYSVPPAYRGQTLQGRRDVEAQTMTLYHEGRQIKTLQLLPPGAHKTVVDSVDRTEHLKLWREGRDAEERRMRRQVERKKQRAAAANIIQDPAIYDTVVDQDYATEVAV